MSVDTTRPESALRFTLRQLPCAAKLVLTVFLLFVGAGYGSALVQLHFQQASKGQHLPTLEDVVRQFSKPEDADRFFPPPAEEPETVAPKAPTAPVTDCQLRRLLTKPESMPFNGTGSMAPAFTSKASGWQKDVKKRGEQELRAEREGERLAFVAWIDAGGKKEAYDADKFPLPEALRDRPITEDFVEGTGPAKALKVQSLIAERCLKCHEGDSGQGKSHLGSYEALAKYLKPIPAAASGGSKATTRAVRQQVDAEKLTQSTHAHALSFAVLFTLTGLVFAFSSYPGWLRVILAPLPLLAQAIDVSCWWLARLDHVGPYFAMAIIGTGAVVGAGLAAQIVLGLFDLYGRVGKTVLVLLFLASVGGLYVFNTCVWEDKVLKPEREAVSKEAEDRAKTQRQEQPNPPAPGQQNK